MGAKVGPTDDEGKEVPTIPVSRFVWERQVKRLTTLDPGIKQFGVFLATYCTVKTGADIRPGITLLSEDLGLSRRQIIRKMQQLSDTGLIQQLSDGARKGRPSEGRRGEASVYRLSMPVDAATRFDARPDPDEDGPQ